MCVHNMNQIGTSLHKVQTRYNSMHEYCKKTIKDMENMGIQEAKQINQ